MGILTPERSPGVVALPPTREPEEQSCTRTGPRNRRGCTWARWMVLVLIAATLVGDMTMPATVERFPLLLILLSPRWRHLLLVSRRMPPGLFLSLGLVRRMVTMLAFHRFGRCGLSRDPRSSALGRPAHRRALQLQAWLRRSSAVLLVVFPGIPAALLAGMEGVPFPKAAALAVVGTLARLLVLTGIGGAFSGPLDHAIAFISAHHLQFTGVIFALIIARALRTWIRARRHFLRKGVDHMPEEQPVYSRELVGQISDFER
jgi:hypothetical protein